MGVAAVRSAFRIRPISARSPQPFLLLDGGYGSSSTVRYVSGGLLFLKPLGTTITMLPCKEPVNKYLVRRRTFQQDITIVFRISYEELR